MKRCPCPCRRELDKYHDRCEDQADRNRRCQHGCAPECHRYDGHPAKNQEARPDTSFYRFAPIYDNEGGQI